MVCAPAGEGRSVNITRQQAVAISRDIDEALKTVSAKHGITFSSSRSKYGSEYSYTVKGSIPVLDETGFDRGTPEAQAWLALGDWEIKQAFNYPETLPFTPDQALGVEFSYGGKHYTFLGMTPRARKYPLLAKGTDGKTWKFGVNILRSVNEAIGEAAA